MKLKNSAKFIQIWQKPNSNPKMLTNSFHKGQVLKDFINWWNENYHLFNP